MLFQLREHVHPQDGAMPTFFHESRSPLLVLSIDVSFDLRFFWKGDKNFRNWTSGWIYKEDPVFSRIYTCDLKTMCCSQHQILWYQWTMAVNFMMSFIIHSYDSCRPRILKKITYKVWRIKDETNSKFGH